MMEAQIKIRLKTLLFNFLRLSNLKLRNLRLINSKNTNNIPQTVN